MSATALSWNNAAMPRPKTGETPKRNFRVTETIWAPAAEQADQEGRTMSAVISRLLARYARKPRRDVERDPWDVVSVVMRELRIDVSRDVDLDEAVSIAADLLRALDVQPVSKER